MSDRPLAVRLRDRLTRAYVDAYYASESEALGDGLYWFESDGDTVGQATPFGTVILNRRAFARLSPATREYVLAHERGHGGRGLLFGGCYWGTFAAWSLAGALFVYSGLGTLVGGSAVPLAAPGFLLATLAFLAVWWLDELRADLAALGTVGEERLRTAHRELRGGRPTALARLVYPAPATTARVRRLLVRLRGRKPRV
ncbi:hypothetical protein [Halosegnis marinus]|uniref:Peptidase M48 domain-containing protein n=1 Tax=Halosegnis marinus TaxID=3034023 RepID=A0ABD5ZS24_9EURY|nr:hypothetical protein [Halosegnis sp. DT85]